MVVVLVPLTVYWVMTWPLRDWIVDDAGITFAYARSLADGHGLVAQPGLEQVEGFSNPLWLLLMSVFFFLGVFDPYWVPKLVGIVLIGISFYLLHRSMIRLTSGRRLISLIALVCLATNASFAVWTCSGLENSLWVALAALLLRNLTDYAQQTEHAIKRAAVTGVIVCGIALTRPDGIVYGWVFPAFLVILYLTSDRPALREYAKLLAVYLATVISIMGLVVVARLAYFGLWFPNTYYAKGGPTLHEVWLALTLQAGFLAKGQQLLAAVFGEHLWFVIVGLAALVVWPWLGAGARWRAKLPLVFMTITSYAVFMILPADWMREYRFATPFIALSYIMVVVLGWYLIDATVHRRRLRTVISIVATAALVLYNASIHVPRLQYFDRWPVVPFEDVAREYAWRFNQYATELEITDGSVLLPDIGGTLYYSDLQVIDLGCLCDTTIARTLLKNQSRFYDYVFDIVKPTFIHVHGTWTMRADFDADPRFRRDYVAIKEYPDEWVKARSGREMMSGHFVRRDQVRGKEDLLSGLNGD
jgi:hypothetical protein